MKFRIILLFTMAHSLVNAYQVREGLFNYFIAEKTDTSQGATYVVTYEKRENGSSSRVITVNGLNVFNEVVLKGSLVKPVIIKINSPKSSDSVRSLNLFQEIADDYSDTISCVEMDLFATHNEQPENYQIILSIMAQFGINRLQLPTYLFYRNGKQLVHLPIVHGFQDQEQLRALIKEHVL